MDCDRYPEGELMRDYLWQLSTVLLFELRSTLLNLVHDPLWVLVNMTIMISDKPQSTSP